MRRTNVLVGFALVLGCTRINPAFDAIDELGEESETGDGDGDSGDGDGEPGDGDGEPGDGDGEPGDGDGEPGDGDGDGDGEPGDGDGEPGDGDGEPNLCEFPIDIDATPALFSGGITVEVADAPGFALQPVDCQILTICPAAQASCGPNTPYIVQINSGGLAAAGITLADVYAIQMSFTPGKPSCGMPPLIFDPNQAIKLHSINDENTPITLSARLPCFEGTELRLWVGDDGSTFYDPDLQEPAALW